MMLAFICIAGALAAGAATLLLLPLLRRREDGQPVAGVTAGAVVFALLLGAGGLYAAFSNFSWSNAPDVANTPASLAAGLAKKLAREPEDLPGWLMLGRSYFELEQYPLAQRAYQRADRLAGGNNTEAIMGFAETLLAQNFEEIRGGAGKMFERVLELEPRNPKALLYAALAAMGRGETAVARDRFTRMLALNPREDIRTIIEKQLSSLAVMEAQQAGSQEGEQPGGQTPGQVGGDAQIRVSVSVAPSLRYQVTDASALFVLARDPNQPGPPFAAKRLPLQFPAEVTLSAGDAMLPGRSIQPGQTLEVLARISLAGQPQSASGDPFGQVVYQVGKDGTLKIVIDKLAP
jgi:cytochrome c-type biogenesis protein CcmH